MALFSTLFNPHHTESRNDNEPVRRLSIVSVLLATLFLQISMNESRASENNLPVGKASRVVNQVEALKEEATRPLSQEDSVYSLERISAGLDSHGEILLNDDTHILVGPGAEVSLDDFVISDSGIQSATINVLKGAFRFVSGNSPKGTFKIKTPLSTIGIRGTLFDIYVRDGGETDVVLYKGRVRVCTLTNRCRSIWQKCGVVRVASRRKIGFRKFLRLRKKRIEADDYNLVSNQNRFQKAWRAPTVDCDHSTDRHQNEGDTPSDPADNGRSERGSKEVSVTPGLK